MLSYIVYDMELVESGLEFDDEEANSTGDVHSNDSEEEVEFVTGA